MRYYGCMALVCFSLVVTPAHASPKDELEKTKADIAQSQAEQAKLAKEQEKLEKELRALQQLLVKTAGITQKSESDMARAASKLRILNEQLKLRDKELSERRKNLAAMVQAALHLNQVPPEAIALVPGEEKTQGAIRAAGVLKMTSDSIRKEMTVITEQSEALVRLKQKAAGRQKDLVESQEDLSEDRATLQKRLEERKALKKKLGQRREEEERHAAELAQKAKSLQALLSGISRASTDGGKRSGRSFASAKGRLRLPVAGTLVQHYGAPAQRENNRGIVLAARADRAQVVAPFDGQVAFAGTFLNYGKLVILKHSDAFHTLLAGLDDIDVRVGDFLLEGEPIGAMGNDASGHRLYLELRKDNQPVNPEPWIKDLKNN